MVATGKHFLLYGLNTLPIATYQGKLEYKDTLGFIRDGNKFVQNFAGMIDVSAPHLYLSALPFAPCKSILAILLAPQFPKTAKVAVGQCVDWPMNQLAIQGHTDSVNSVAFSPDGRVIVSGSSDQTIRVWDAQTGGQVSKPLQGHTNAVNSVAFSQDGRYIVSGSGDHTIQVWDAQIGGQMSSPLEGHTTPVSSIAFSPDGKYIVSGSNDRTIRLWDVWTGGQVGSLLQRHSSSVHSVSFSPDERHLHDGTIQLLEAETISTMERCLQSKITKCPLIHFSSSIEHALHNTHNLFFDLSDVIEDCRDLVYLQDDGWIVGPNKKLLLWIPFSYHSSFHYTPWIRLVFPKGVPELDLSRMAHGSTWYGCYLPITSYAV